MRMSAAEIAALVEGTVAGDGSVMVTGAEVDSRLVGPGDLFVALPGARRDGHEFVAAALDSGAAALVRSDAALPAPAPGQALIRVRDPLAAYHRLARYERVNRGWRVVAVTGSVGKTTTKEMIASLLGGRFRVGVTHGNRNSTLGLPAQLLSQPVAVELMVAEAGMSHAGEIDALGAILAPDVAVYTRLAAVHTEFFADGLAGVVRAKAELLRHLDPEGRLVVNADDPLQAGFAGDCDAATVRYSTGVGEGAGVRVRVLEDRGLLGSRVELVLPDGVAEAELRLAGGHQVENLAAAVAAAHAVELPATAIADEVARLEPAPRRGQIITTSAGVTVVDDSYNASPTAMARLLELLARAPGRRVAVLGEMYELGELTAAAHGEVGALAAGACDLLVAVGGVPARRLAEAARAAGLEVAEWLPDAAAAARRLAAVVEPGDVVLVKGSRGIGLELVVDRLTGREAG